MGNTLSLTSMGIVKPLNLILHIWNGNSVKGGVSRAKFNCIMSLTFCHYNWLNSAVVTLRLFAPTCKVAEKLSGKVANRTTQTEWEWEWGKKRTRQRQSTIHCCSNICGNCSCCICIL